MLFVSIRKVAAGLMILAGPITVSGAIQIDAFSTLEHDRFANSSQFIADGFDLSGVGIADNGRWATMVSNNVFLSAHHFHPANGTNVTFYSGNDPNGLSSVRTVVQSQRILNSDLRVGRLDAPLGAQFSPLPFVSSLTLPSEVFLFGRSPTNRMVSQDMAVGKNVLDGTVTTTMTFNPDGVAPQTTDRFLTAVDDATNTGNFVPSEAFLQSGDSGAPVLMDDGNGGLTIVGTNSFIGKNGSGQDISGITSVGKYDQEVQAFIVANQVTVPEPSAFAAVLGGVVLLMAGTRRGARGRFPGGGRGGRPLRPLRPLRPVLGGCGWTVRGSLGQRRRRSNQALASTSAR